VALAQEIVGARRAPPAARSAAPGAGAAAALAGAIAAALAEMAAAFAPERGPEPGEPAAEVRRRAGALQAQLLELGDADALAYQPVLDAMALDRGDPRRAAALAAALSAAAEVPLQIAAACSEVAELAAAAARELGGTALFGEAHAAAIIAEAATRAAVALVELDLEGSPTDARMRHAEALAGRALAARAELAGESER
jgi:formiminotetrahydrofolate cyclodeaminase